MPGTTAETSALQDMLKQLETVATRKVKLFLLAVTFAIYIPSLTASFVFDDHVLIEENPFLSSSRGLVMAFTQDYYAQSNPNAGLGYYRPVSVLSHWIDWQLWKDHPFGHHLTNVLLHLVAMLLLYELLVLIFEDINFAFLASLLFAIHPSHVSTVSFVSARVDAIATIFVLLSLYTFKKKKILSPLFYFLALLSKEISVTTPILIWWEQREKKWKSIVLSLLPFAVVLLAVLLLRLRILGRLSRGQLTLDPNSVLLLLDYVRLLVLPPVKLYLEPAINNLPVILDLGCAAVFVLALVFLRDKQKSGWSAIWLVTLLPVLGFIRLETTIDERFLYLPSISFCIVAAAWLVRYLESRTADKVVKPRAVWMIACILLLIYLPILLTRQAYWNNEISLWGAAVDSDPDSIKARNNYAMALMNANQLKEADLELAHALNLRDPRGQKAYSYLSLALLRRLQKRDQEVEPLYKNSIRLNPRFFISHYNLGLYYWEQQRLEEAISELKIAVELNPYSGKAHLLLSQLLARAGHPEEAHIHADLARQLGQ